MIKLHPIPDVIHHCPYDNTKLNVNDWYIPGMRNLADLQCPKCSREFYGDLPAGHGLYYPMLLDKNNGKVSDSHHVRWFADWLRLSYEKRNAEPLKMNIETLGPLQNPLLLNCLDTLYGHCLLKLLNVQYYLDNRPDFDVIVLIPKYLRWMVPDGVAAIWTVDLPLRKGFLWNDGLAQEIRKLIEQYKVAWLSIAFSHPHPNDFTIERFTKIKPFPVAEWVERLKRPAVTFIWRNDRSWSVENNSSSRWLRLLRRIKHRLLREKYARTQIKEETRNIITLATELKKAMPDLDFAVTGIGSPGNMPSWIHDMRTIQMTEEKERNFCKRYSESHIVIGVHGSNMLLPTAHSGSVIELVPIDRWGNIIQDILLRSNDIRDVLYRCRFIPIESSVHTVSEAALSLLKEFPEVVLNFSYPYTDHDHVQDDPFNIMKQRLSDSKAISKLTSR